MLGNNSPWASARRILNMLNGSTILGFIVARLGHATLTRGPCHVWYAQGYSLSFPVAGAFTIGNVILTSTSVDALTRRNPRVIDHEKRHCTQYAILGTAFLPIYAMCAATSWALTRDTGSHNPLERWAGLEDGGYKIKSVIWRRPHSSC